MPKLKYKSKIVYWDTHREIVISKESADKYRHRKTHKLPDYIYRFDSAHEFNVYLELLRMYGNDRIARQYPVVIFPSTICYPTGKTWRIDFAIKTANDSNNIVRFVEAKGLLVPENRVTIGAFENHDSKAFSKLRLVFPRGLPLENSFIKTLYTSGCPNVLLTLPQLKELHALP